MLAYLAYAAIATATPADDFRGFAKPVGSKEWNGAAEAPANVGPKFRMIDDQESGEPLIVSGIIYLPDGKTPAEGALLYVYHTDSKGLYSRGSNRGNGQRHGKLRGWMLTGKDGMYEFRTIKPGSYPGGGNPAHIHATLTAPRFPEHWIEDFHFDGDPYLPASEVSKHRGSGLFNPILKPQRLGDGVWRARRDLKLQPPSQSNGGSG